MGALFHRSMFPLLAGLLLLAPSVPAADELTCKAIPRLARSYLKQHIRFKDLTPELKARTAELYLERIDPSKVLFLASEAASEQEQLATAFDSIEEGACDPLVGLHGRVVARYRAMEKAVRETLGRDDYQVDYATTLTLDPDDRGFPADAASRNALYRDLIHFQMSNYLATDENLAEAKRRLIHRYELLTLRASEQDSEDIYSVFLDAFATALDPHSNYLSAQQLEEFQISMGLSLEGIGVALSSKDGYSVVERVIPGGATDRLGLLQPNDRIIAVAQDGGEPVDIVDMALRDVVRMIRGKKGTKVHLTILRQGETAERFNVTIVRDKIDLEEQAAKLRWEEVERDGRNLKLAVLELPSFYGDSDPRKRRAATDVARLLRDVREEQADGLVLDLSRNGGGLLDHAVRISGFFLRSGGVVAVQDSDARTKVLRDPDPGILYSGPMVVLTSRVSASASEILAGALQDYGRAVIVGDEHTFGKGTVQTVVTLPDGLGAMKVTTGIFYLPGGISTQHRGVVSDVTIPSFTTAEEFGERYQPFALQGRKIDPFRDARTSSLLPFGRKEDGAQPWNAITSPLLMELGQRSRARVAANEDFDRIREHIAKKKDDDGTVTLAELRKDRNEAKAEAEANGEAKPSDGEAVAEADEKDEADELSVGAKEAVQILADLVELQTTGATTAATSPSN